MSIALAKRGIFWYTCSSREDFPLILIVFSQSQKYARPFWLYFHLVPFIALFVCLVSRFCLAHRLPMPSSDSWSVFLSVCQDVCLEPKGTKEEEQP